MRIVCAGDQFIGPQLFADALADELGGGHEYIHLQSSWPREPLKSAGEVYEHVGDEAELQRAMRGAHVLVTHVAPVTRAVMSASEGRLRIVGCCRGGPVNVNVSAATELGIPVICTPGRNSAATAEFTICLLLAGLRRLVQAATELSRGRWAGELYDYQEAGMELSGKTVGVVGLGEVGSRVARILRAFDARVVAYDPYVIVDATRDGGGVELVSLEDLLRESDIVTLHSRLTAETRGVIGVDAIRAMKRGAFLVNAARGGLLDYRALTAALKSGHLAGAALDVFDEEPPPENSELLRLPQVLATPHIAGASRETAHRGARQAAAEIGRFTRGEPLINCVNPEALSR